MKKPSIPYLSVIVAILIMGALFSPSYVRSEDQAANRITVITGIPSGVILYDVAWNENTYEYAICVGENTTAGSPVVYRYSPRYGWDLLYEVGLGEVLYEVIYDTFNNTDTFFILADNGGESSAYKMDNANTPSPLVTPLGGPPPGEGYLGGCFDWSTGPQGTLVAVGTPYSTLKGIIAWHDMSAPPDVWSYVNTASGDILEAATWNYNTTDPIIIVVGHNANTNSAVAYAFDYENTYPLTVPPDAGAFYGIDWYPGYPNGYAVVVGEDKSGNGKVWKLANLHETRHISYYQSTVGNECLKYAYYDGISWRIEVVDPSPYAGYYTSMALDVFGRPHISYWDGGTADLKHAWKEGGRWYVETVDDLGNVGQYTSIAIDSGNNIHISYYDLGSGYLKYAYFNGTGWNTVVVDSSTDTGKYTSIALDALENPHISYLNVTNEDLKHAWYNGTWNIETVDSTGAVGYYTSIDMDSLGYPHIAYSDTTLGQMKYAVYDGTGWNIEVAQSISSSYISLALDSSDIPHISYIQNGLDYTKKENTTWYSAGVIDSSGGYDTSIALDRKENPCISYYDSTNLDLKYAYYDGSSWRTEIVDSAGNVGRYSSLVLGFDGVFTPLKIDTTSPILRDIDWKDDGGSAIIVGDRGAVFMYYEGSPYLSNWSDTSTFDGDLLGVAVKSPASPAYGFSVSLASAVKISYQVSNTATEITARAIEPNLNYIDFLDSTLQPRMNQQVDVGGTYTFFINGSYTRGWNYIGGIDIFAWYDNGNDLSNYNDTQGANLNFRLHFYPDPVDPFNNSGTWELLWPVNGEVTLAGWYQTVEDGPSGTPGVNDANDYYLLRVNVTFGPQVRYAPGDGTWDISTNQSDRLVSLNDAYSWNFNITMYDIDDPTVRQTRYDEFGIYIYTEISVQNNPSGMGAPGTTIELLPSSHIGIRTNREYLVIVNITDLKNATGGRSISRSNVEVRNPTANNDTSASYIWDWTPFSALAPLYVWGNNSSGKVMPPLENGTCTAGYFYGYDPTVIYTTVEWRLTIPPNTPEDEYRATITYEIGYV